MTLLTQEAQEKVVSLLISEGLVSSEKVQEVVEEIATSCDFNCEKSDRCGDRNACNGGDN